MTKQKTLDGEISKEIAKVRCEVCGREFDQIACAHLKTHDITMSEYREQFPDALLVSEDLRKKLSDATSGEKNGMYGVHRYDENAPNYGHRHTYKAKQKQREAQLGKPSGMKGKYHSEETKQKQSEANSGEKHPNYGKKHPGLNAGENNGMHGIHHCGGDAPNWQGGISNLPYCEKFDNDLKERVREFFNRCCYVCGKNEIENGRKLDIHHINYDKMVCCNDVKPLFVPLCMSCHRKTNGDRKYWEEFFTISLKCLTKNECFLPKEMNKK